MAIVGKVLFSEFYSKNRTMKLSELKAGEQAIIVRVTGKGSFRRRIVEMGFINGEKISVVQNAPLHDPVEYDIMGYRVSLRRVEAALIEVMPLSEVVDTKGEELKGIPNENSDLQDTARRGDKHSRTLLVALVGNPNCGKTSLFNVASGGHEKVGNYAGVTVDSKEGDFDFNGYHIRLVDLPGTYSMTSYSPEELYVRKYIFDEMPDVVVNVIDSSNLKRNLYLTTQLIDMDIQMVCALNMYDDLQAQGDKLDKNLLGELLGVPMVPTVCREGKGIDELFTEVIRVYEGKSHTRHIHINHGELLEKYIRAIQSEIKEFAPALLQYSTRFLAIKWLENDKFSMDYLETQFNTRDLYQLKRDAERQIKELNHENLETSLTNAKYAFIQGALKETFQERVGVRHKWTERIDQWITHPWLSYPIFFLILFIIFDATFVLGDYPMQGIEWLVAWLNETVSTWMPDGQLKDLVTDGIIAGVGSVIVFLPNILILYLFISLLEDSGYMARAVFIMDKIMHKMGLHGKSFIPLIMGFGCNVPAIMATRTIESRKGRLITMLITPLMSCSARLPVYLIVIGACFPRYGGVVLFGLYALGILLSMVLARLFSRFLVKRPDAPFVMELPPYRFPTAKSVLSHTWEKGKQYLRKMGGIILFASILVWFLGYYPHHDQYANSEEQMENSYMGHIGKAIEPVMSPMGFDWKQDVGLLAGLGAKELVVSTMGVIYAAGDDEKNLSNQLSQTMSPPVALAFLVFVLLYFPCFAALAAIKHESERWRWMFFTVFYTTALAWIASFVTYQIASLFF